MYQGGRGCLGSDGQYHRHGTSYTAPDGCNTCSCNNGAEGCTLMACVPEGEFSQFRDALKRLLGRFVIQLCKKNYNNV